MLSGRRERFGRCGVCKVVAFLGGRILGLTYMASGGLTICLLDDDEEVRESLRVFLASEGFKVKTNASALDFLSDGEAKAPGCAVSEVRMPGTGDRRARRLPRWRWYGWPVPPEDP